MNTIDYVMLSFGNLYSAVTIEQRTLDPFFPQTVDALHNFNRSLTNVAKTDLDTFILNNFSQLSTIYSFIREQAIPKTKSFEDYLKEEKLGSKKAMYRILYTNVRKDLASLTEKIFVKQLGIQPNKDGKLPMLCTPIFENFIIGITKFAGVNQEKAFPSYHRSDSCGPYKDNPTFRQKNKNCLKKKLSPSEVARRRLIAERCFIERLIYDEIFKQTCWSSETQDKGHIEAIKQAQNDYMGCYPGQDIRVRMDMHMSLPYVLVIEKYKNNKLVFTEKYERRLVSNNNVIKHDFAIQCEKEDHIKHKKYFKCQLIHEPEQKWISLDSASRASSPTLETIYRSHIRQSRSYS